LYSFASRKNLGKPAAILWPPEAGKWVSLRDFSTAYVRSANSADWLMFNAAGVAAGSFLGRPRTQCRSNCPDSPLTNSSSPNGRPA
jgi:hypothetical protein